MLATIIGVMKPYMDDCFEKKKKKKNKKIVEFCTYSSKHWQFHPIPMILRDLLAILSMKK